MNRRPIIPVFHESELKRETETGVAVSLLLLGAGERRLALCRHLRACNRHRRQRPGKARRRSVFSKLTVASECSFRDAGGRLRNLRRELRGEIVSRARTGRALCRAGLNRRLVLSDL